MAVGQITFFWGVGDFEPMGASFKNTWGCAGGRKCRKVEMRVCHTTRGTERKRHTVNSGLTTGRISGNVMHFRSVAKQYTPQRFSPVARHNTRRACSCARGALLKATDRTVATLGIKRHAMFV